MNVSEAAAARLAKIAEVVFPEQKNSVEATDILLNIAALGKTADGNALLPG